ncbi:MAG TPA: phosphatase PAP2 family protein [Methylomirabilota bacterium]|nr:phosphatase PAP2 family protein [Methylomirabilota bacterium]
MSTRTFGWRGSLSAPIGVASVLVLLFFPFDGAIVRSFVGLKLGPDFRVELQTVQQYGQLSATLMGMAIIWLADPRQRRRLLDWLAAIAVSDLSCLLLKICLGRPRPKYGDPMAFMGLWHAYPFPTKTGELALRYSWDLTQRHPWELWSMPSSHTALAAVMSVFLISLYPRLRPFAVVMIVLVGCCRVLFRDHYPTDVIVGAMVGYVIARYAITFCWGQQAFDWLRWKPEGERAPEASVPIAD